MICRTSTFWAQGAMAFSLILVAMYLRQDHHGRTGAVAVITLGIILLPLAVVCFRGAQQYGLLMEQRCAATRRWRWLPERFYSANYFSRSAHIFAVLGGIMAVQISVTGILLLMRD